MTRRLTPEQKARREAAEIRDWAEHRAYRARQRALNALMGHCAVHGGRYMVAFPDGPECLTCRWLSIQKKSP